jgi:RNA polymerase sigma factor for flagellar operon FliA
MAMRIRRKKINRADLLASLTAKAKATKGEREDRAEAKKCGLTVEQLHLVRDHTKWALSSAARVAAKIPGITIDDVSGEVLKELLRLAKRYDPAQDIQFKTYAGGRIKGAVMDWVRQWDWVPRLERTNGFDGAGMYSNALFQGEDDHGGVSVTAAQMEREDPSALDPHKFASNADLIAYLIRGLSTEEKELIELYYLGSRTMKEIAEIQGLSESRICQIHKQALDFMRLRGIALLGREDTVEDVA